MKSGKKRRVRCRSCGKLGRMPNHPVEIINEKTGKTIMRLPFPMHPTCYRDSGIRKFREADEETRSSAFKAVLIRQIERVDRRTIHDLERYWESSGRRLT